MLNKKSKALMKQVYNKAVEKDGTCLISQNDLLATLPNTMQFRKNDLTVCLKALVSEGYVEMITTEKKGEDYYCITLQKLGYDFAYQLAKEAGDPNWTKLKSFTSKRKDCIEKIMAKYGPKAEKMAKIAQKNYIAIASKVSASAKKS